MITLALEFYDRCGLAGWYLEFYDNQTEKIARWYCTRQEGIAILKEWESVGEKITIFDSLVWIFESDQCITDHATMTGMYDQ